MSEWSDTRAVIFDFNGTISDDEPILEEIFLQLLAEEGRHIDRDRYHRELAGYSDKEILERALEGQRRPVSADRVQELLRRKIDLYRTKVAMHSPISAAAATFVVATSNRVPIAIASGAPREEVEFVLAKTGLRGLFAAVVCLEDVGKGKPDPEGYLRALHELNRVGRDRAIAPYETLVFEDADPGVQAAKAAGMRCVALRTPAYTGVPVPADAVVDQLDARLIDELL